jgi:hypothetical protein
MCRRQPRGSVPKEAAWASNWLMLSNNGGGAFWRPCPAMQVIFYAAFEWSASKAQGFLCNKELKHNLRWNVRNTSLEAADNRGMYVHVNETFSLLYWYNNLAACASIGQSLLFLDHHLAACPTMRVLMYVHVVCPSSFLWDYSLSGQLSPCSKSSHYVSAHKQASK